MICTKSQRHGVPVACPRIVKIVDGQRIGWAGGGF